MKKMVKHIQSLLMLFFLAGLIACNKDFLEVIPKGNLIATTTADYDKSLDNLILLNIAAVFGASSPQVVMGDEIAAVDPYFSGSKLITQRLFRWEDVIYEADQDANEMITPMKNIYAYNKIINEVMDASDGSEEKKKSIRAEAMAGRAWTYFLLINYYGKPYNPASAATDPGFPVVTEADVTETHFSRATVQEVYDFIINDIATAIPDLPARTTERLRMSRAAAEGLLGKVYVFMGKFDKALPFLDASLTDISTASIPVRLYDYNKTFAPDGTFMPIGTFGPSYPLAPHNEEVLYAKQFVNSWSFLNNELVLTPQTRALYSSSDLRLKFFSKATFSGSDYPDGLLRRTSPTNTQFGVILPELYLLRAECKARLNDLDGAATDLETLRKNRMPLPDAKVPDSLKADQKALISFIFDERTREFSLKGYRWFDMRRLSVDPNYKYLVKTTHILYDENGEVKATFKLRPERLVLRLAPKIINQNPGMKNNP